MVPRRLAFSLLVASLVLGPGAATAGVPVGMYPFRVPGLSGAQRTELHGILDSALAAMSRRGILSSRSPVLLPLTCGESPTPACLAEAAKGGLVLAGRGEPKGGGVVLVTAAMWDAHGCEDRCAEACRRGARPGGGRRAGGAAALEAAGGAVAHRDRRRAPRRRRGGRIREPQPRRRSRGEVRARRARQLRPVLL